MAKAPEGSYVGELRRAILRYKTLIGGSVDLETTLKVEEAERLVAARVRRAVEEAVIRGQNLEDVASSLLESGVLDELAKEVGGLLGLQPPRSVEEALEHMASGDLSSDESRVAFVVMQGVARTYADLLLEREGVPERLGTRCPVCGAESDILVAEPGGGYSMLCPFCFYKWRLPGGGLRCPRCGSADKFSLGIYTDRNDKRVALLHCQECGFTGRLILDRTIRAPRSVLPLIALGADRFRAYTGALEG
jgi:Zn ribbon nucleic-acid-binding protein